MEVVVTIILCRSGNKIPAINLTRNALELLRTNVQCLLVHANCVLYRLFRAFMVLGALRQRFSTAHVSHHRFTALSRYEF